MEPTWTHRRDIDGLRAIAVLLVVLYHYGITPFSGGYVGVDVFFVISGYVITAKVRRELAAGTFTLLSFYAGRVRRILPALAFVILACLIAGWFLLMPADYRDLGDQAAFAAVGLSNFYFLDNSGYFARASDLLPLLHTWSLGIEEQFYLIWPALLLLLGLKLSQKTAVVVLGCLIAVSLILSTIAVLDDQPTAFYMLHTRATVQSLTSAGRKVVLFAPVPSNEGSIPLIASRMMMHDESNTLSISLERYMETNRPILDLVDELDQLQKVSVVRPATLLCDATNCRTVFSGRSLYFDRHHPSMFGAKWLIEQIRSEAPERIALGQPARTQPSPSY